MLCLLLDIPKRWQTRVSTTLGVSYTAISESKGTGAAAKSRAVLLEAPFDPIRRQMNSVLLTVDLTKAVADEAIQRKDCVVVAYRTYRAVHYDMGSC